ncbi:MAG TPA: sulfatase-like hydrolase/transferase [Pseudobdellovibrionaceae bacterium]|nr:sulfatase-like hydrolase/transferase [Pseudobdellovibrionaceae bacterium]
MAKQTKIFLLLLIFLIFGALLYFLPKNQKQTSSILVIAVDQLGYFDFNCSPNHSLNNPAAQLICPESLRFTHAFTTSPLSAPALASILTGQYPQTHLLHHNSGPGLSPGLRSVAEAAYSLNYKTSFFSGGPPLLRRTGLAQGFEIFDDRLTFFRGSFYRPLSHMLFSIEEWLTENVKKNPFFSVIYANELSYTTTQHFDESGRPLKMGYETQATNLYSSLAKLFQTLKKLDRWDNTHIIIVGLNGRNKQHHPDEIEPLNLFSENTHIALLFKPAQKKRDQGISWKVDDNINIADLGRTLFELLSQSWPEPITQGDLPILSLKKFSERKQEKDLILNFESRPLLIQSHWANWHKFGEIRHALILDHYLLINDLKQKIYNTLSDNLESTPLSDTTLNPLVYEKFNTLIAKYNFKPFALTSLSKSNPFSIPKEEWLLPDFENELIDELLHILRKNPENVEYHGLLSSFLLKRNDWQKLKNISKINKFKNTYLVAEAHLKNSQKLPLQKFLEPSCTEALNSNNISFSQIKKCSNPYLSSFLQLHFALELNQNPDLSKEKFLQLLGQLQLEQYIKVQNLSQKWILDPLNTSEVPNLVQLILTFPHYNIKGQIKAEIPFPKPIEVEFTEE